MAAGYAGTNGNAERRVSEMIRKNQPKSSEIARYWSDKCITENGRVYKEGSIDFNESVVVVSDWGEPECMACGKFYREYASYEKKDNDVFECWNRNKYLQKCHITPHMLGGDDTAPSNFLLLCKNCHKESPDMIDPKYIMKWVYSKRKKDRKLMETGLWMSEVENYLSEISCETPVPRMLVEIMTAHLGENANIASHAGSVSKSTILSNACDKAVKTQELMKEFENALMGVVLQ